MQRAKEDINLEFRVRLQEELSRRMRVNERYSVRAFANSLKLDSSTVSKILAGKRLVSDIKMKEICEKLGIGMPGEGKSDSDFAVLDLDSFAVISDWYHFAILDLTLLKAFKNDENWIARKLSIKPFEAVQAITRLKRLGMLVEKNGKLKKAEGFYTNYSEGTTSAALKEYQRQVIQKALHAVDNCPQEQKDITSMTIAADSRKINEAKEKIKKFRRELCDFLEAGEGDSVFHLALQLYPVTDIEV
jgi:transcriptional regulator with XRE-family HTH domain